MAERGTLYDPGPAFYMEKIAVGPAAAHCIDIRASVEENLRRIAGGLDKQALALPTAPAFCLNCCLPSHPHRLHAAANPRGATLQDAAAVLHRRTKAHAAQNDWCKDRKFELRRPSTRQRVAQ